MEHIQSRLIALCGIGILLLAAWVMSSDRKNVPRRIIIGGLLLQFLLAALILKTSGGKEVFRAANSAVVAIDSFVDQGSEFVFGLHDASAVQGNRRLIVGTFAFSVLPTVIFYSCLMSVLYHLGVMQVVVKATAMVMQITLGTSGPETLSAAANIFLGQTEAPLVIRPFIGSMSRSELNAMMVGGFANISASVLAIYHDFGIDVGHLLTASVISAPASLLIAKLMEPEKPGADVNKSLRLTNERTSTNLIGAAAQGASDGLMLALNIGAMLIAFLALIAMLDFFVTQLGMAVGFKNEQGEATLNLKTILGTIGAPFAWLMGIPWSECGAAGELLGTKMFANEFLAYRDLEVMCSSETPIMSERSKTIMTYALCGFANFSSIGIQVGGIGSLVPSRRNELASLGLRAMIGGTFSCFMTACVASVLI